ncbi:sensor histidine kinase [Veronia nyctiphanis]|uniref:Sensor histidine kinase n=1 Tax=Veronia nyctiphanis TaxID=1278244 RepID=A0A4Q0YU69_9GAMM|nr:histidine kinase [Veronia nyctiphanis]RXJ74800.1 sensor histidine kinase [Veronia nyctiphanis]
MPKIKQFFANSWVSATLITSVFCFAIAVITYSMWPSTFTDNLIISFGYGYSNLSLSWLSHRFFPNWPEKLRGFIVVPLALLAGTLNCYLLLSGYGASLHVLQPTFIMGLTFTMACMYYLHNREKQMQARQALEEARRKQAEQEKLLVLSELTQLQSQIEPHFLFNTLANIDALIDMEPRKAQQMLRHLTDLLRSSLQLGRERLISIDRESGLINDYLKIQKIRLGEELSFEIHADPSLSHIQIPPFLLQPLVENAVVHGIEPDIERGHIDIRFVLDKHDYLLCVSDSGIGLRDNTQSKGNGIAVKNIRSRIETLFGEQASLSISENPDKGVTSSIRINKNALEQLAIQESL